MESGGENRSAASSKSVGFGNGGLSGQDTWELGAPCWDALRHAPHHPSVPSAFFHPIPPTFQAVSSSSSFSSLSPALFSHSHDHRRDGDAHHLTCLKLGKRQYYEEAPHPSELAAAAAAGMKREKVATGGPGIPSPSPAVPTPPSSSSSAAVVPRCQVEGCNVVLVDAKDYHRRHKVCEMHSKAPKVVVLGIEQRFCQQCSRFHVISEFDESKRSCRRRLAGHNERRRKNSAEATVRNLSHIDGSAALGGGFPSAAASTTPSRALSLLSPKGPPWVSPDLSSQSSAALRELIAENRAAILARQLFSDRGWNNNACEGAQAVHLSQVPRQHGAPLGAASGLAATDGWEHLRGPSPHVTLDLMQMPAVSSFELLDGRSRSKDDEEECCDIWKSLEGTHVI